MAYMQDDEGRVFYIDPETGERQRVRGDQMDTYQNYMALPTDVRDTQTPQQLQNWAQIQATTGQDILNKYWDLSQLSDQSYSFGSPLQYVKAVDNYSNYDPAQQIVLMETSGYPVPRSAVRDQAVWDRAHDPVFRKQVTDAAMNTMQNSNFMSDIGKPFSQTIGLALGLSNLASLAGLSGAVETFPGSGIFDTASGVNSAAQAALNAGDIGNAPGITDGGSFLQTAAEAAGDVAGTTGASGLDLLPGTLDSVAGAGTILGDLSGVDLAGLSAAGTYGGLASGIGSSAGTVASVGNSMIDSLSGEGFGGNATNITTNPITGAASVGGGLAAGAATGGGFWDQLLNSLNLPQGLSSSIPTIASALGSYFTNAAAADNLQNAATQAAAMTDPFASQRPFYQGLLKQSFTDPNFFKNDPTFKGLNDYAANQTAAKMASMGYNMSGNQMAEIGKAITNQSYKYVQPQQAALGQFAGAGINPGYSGYLYQQGVNQANAANQQAYGNLGVVGQQIFKGLS